LILNNPSALQPPSSQGKALTGCRPYSTGRRK